MKDLSHHETAGVVLSLSTHCLQAAVKAETVSQTRIVQMIELVFMWLCQQGLEEKECSPAE